MVNDNVASLTSGLWSDNAFGRNNLSGEWSLVLEGVYRNTRLVPVWLSLKVVLGGTETVVMIKIMNVMLENKHV